MNRTIVYVGLGIGLLYAASLYNWGKEISGKVAIKFKNIRSLRFINAKGEKLKLRDLIKFRDLDKIAVEFYIKLDIENTNEFPITMSDFAGDVSYGNDKLATIESTPAYKFVKGLTEYSIKVTQPVIADVAAIAKILSSGDLVRKVRIKGFYEVEVQGKKYTVPFDEKMGVDDL